MESLSIAENHGVERLINASSSPVYGKPDYLPYDENHRNYPQSPYGVTKLTDEHYCRVWDNLFDISTVNLRYFTVYSPRMRPNMAISNFVSRYLNDKPPIIYGDGEQTRDFTYIDDIVRANLTLMNSDSADGESLNIGSTGNITINDLAQFVIEKTAFDLEPIYSEPKNADARHTHADVSKARQLIGYEPTVSIREGVARFIEWYQQNREWYEPLVQASWFSGHLTISQSLSGNPFGIYSSVASRIRRLYSLMSSAYSRSSGGA